MIPKNIKCVQVSPWDIYGLLASELKGVYVTFIGFMASYPIITVCYSHKDNLLMLYLYIGVFISRMITNEHLFKHTFDVISL